MFSHLYIYCLLKKNFSPFWREVADLDKFNFEVSQSVYLNRISHWITFSEYTYDLREL